MKDGADAANLIDRERGIGWYVFFFRGIRLDLSEGARAWLRRNVENHAVYLLLNMARRETGPDTESPQEPPARSPLISCEHITVDGAPALSIIHRMMYRPGLEILMGHVLVPVTEGLFEVRW